MTLRDDLRNPGIASTTHAGLWLDRYLPSFAKSNDTAKGGTREHINRLIKVVHTPDIYRSHYQRWQTHCAVLVAQDTARTAEAKVEGRMIVGLGVESVLEVGISLHRTYGVPMIPGSALKGLAARHARRLDHRAWRCDKQPMTETTDGTAPLLDPSEGQSYRALFGNHGEAGCVVFHDALWIPQREPELPLDLDVMTVHHAKYYGANPKDDTPPADSDDPNPVSFVTAEGTYLIALEGPPAWTDVAMALLKIALISEGIGAKTAAGYGRLNLDYASTALAEVVREQQVADDRALAAKQAAEAAAEQIRKMAESAADRPRRIEELLRDLQVSNASAILPKLLGLVGETERYAIALRCEAKLTRKTVRSAIKDQKTWVQPLAAILSMGDKDTSS